MWDMDEAAQNSGENTAGPQRDPKTGRVSGGNPGNSGGKKGRSGRKPDEFKRFLERARNDKKARRALLSAMRDAESKNFGTAWKINVDYDDAKPGQKVDHRFPELPPEEAAGRIASILNLARARKSSNGNGNGVHSSNGNGHHG